MLLLWINWKTFLVVVEEATEFQQSFLTLPNGLYMTASLLIKNVGMYVPELGNEDTSKNTLTEAVCFWAPARAE